jgi:lipid II:glycine glycyltransferase (peptidoglycan interpeptide bridge formation enzyme)
MADASATRVRAATTADRDAWDAFVAARPEGDVLQSWAWGEAGSGEPGERWSRLLAEDVSGRVRGVAQVLARTTSFGRSVLYVPHGPLWEREAGDADALLDALLAALLDHARAEHGIVLKLDPRALPGDVPAERLAATLAGHRLRRARHDLQAPTTRILDLTGGPDAVLARWSRDARAEARRAEREGVTARVVRTADPGALDAFHALLLETAARAGFRIRSRGFLGRLATHLADAERASSGWYLALASVEHRAIAGAAAPVVGERAFYLYAASSRDATIVHKRGPYAAMAGLVGALADAGVATLDLWGVREPDDPSVDARWEGFSLFKRRFGGAPLRHPGTFDLVIDPLWDRLRELRDRLRGAPP